MTGPKPLSDEELDEEQQRWHEAEEVADEDVLRVFDQAKLACDLTVRLDAANAIARARLDELQKTRAHIAELESLLTQAACDKIEATAFEAMRKRVEAIEGALEWVYRNSEFAQFGPKSLHLYKNGRAVEDGVSSFYTNWFDKETTGEKIADALIALHERSGK